MSELFATSIERLLEFLTEDAQSLEPRMPPVVLHALRNDELTKKLQARFEQGQGVARIYALPYNFYTGMNYSVFQFVDIGSRLPTTEILILTNSDCDIVTLVDPFVARQPNPLLPPLPRNGAQPFVLQQPSASETRPFSGDELYPSEVRSREFFEQLTFFENHRLSSRSTGCTYSTTYNTMIGYTCKRVTGILAPTCDSWGPEYETDEKADNIHDDC
jgi:hypothetical protein